MIDKNQLEEILKFKNTNLSISIKEGAVNYGKLNVTEEKKSKPNPGVYLWLVKNIEGFDVMYVGKAGKGIHKRLSEHLAGYTRNPDSKRANSLKELLANHKFEVWFRESEIREVLGKRVSIYSSEEDALILEYNPPLNKSRSAEPNQKELTA